MVIIRFSVTQNILSKSISSTFIPFENVAAIRM